MRPAFGQYRFGQNWPEQLRPVQPKWPRKVGLVGPMCFSVVGFGCGVCVVPFNLSTRVLCFWPQSGCPPGGLHRSIVDDRKWNPKYNHVFGFIFLLFRVPRCPLEISHAFHSEPLRRTALRQTAVRQTGLRQTAFCRTGLRWTAPNVAFFPSPATNIVLSYPNCGRGSRTWTNQSARVGSLVSLCQTPGGL